MIYNSTHKENKILGKIMASATPLNIYSSNFSSIATSSFGLASVAADVGQLIIYTIQYDNSSTNDVAGPPTWNGQTFVSTGPRALGYMAAQTWYLFATATATADIVCPVTTGGAFQGLALARTYAGILSVDTIVQQTSTDTYADPVLNSPSLSAGDVIDEVLNAGGYDASFNNVTGVTWAETNSQVRQATVVTGAVRVGNLIFSTKAGTGALTVGYTSTGGNPAYVHTLLPLRSTPPTTIDTVTTGGASGLKVNSGFSTTTTGLGNLTEVTIETLGISGAIVAATSLSAFAGDGNAIMPPWVVGEKYPKPGTVSVAAYDATTASARGNFTLSIPDTHSDVVFDNVILSDNTYISKALSDAGHPLADDDRSYYPVGNSLTISPDGKISVAGAMTFLLWIHKVDGTMEAYNVVVNDAGVITSATGITSRGITSRLITTRGITKRGLS